MTTRIHPRVNSSSDALVHFCDPTNKECSSFCTILEHDEDNNMLLLSLIFDDKLSDPHSDPHWILLKISLVNVNRLPSYIPEYKKADYFVKKFELCGGCPCDSCKCCLVERVNDCGNWFIHGEVYNNRKPLSTMLEEISALWHENKEDMIILKNLFPDSSEDGISEEKTSEGESSKLTHNPLHKDGATTIFAAGGGPPYYVENYTEVQKCK